MNSTGMLKKYFRRKKEEEEEKEKMKKGKDVLFQQNYVGKPMGSGRDLIHTQHHHNNHTSTPHMSVGPSVWGPPSCEGLLCGCCIGVVNLTFSFKDYPGHRTRLHNSHGQVNYYYFLINNSHGQVTNKLYSKITMF